jgi:DNA-binding SARP family transcriptional activator
MSRRTSSADPHASARAAWRLRLLGRPALVAADGSRSMALRPKDAALLALVALAGPIQGDRLAAMLWPTATARQADTSLRQRVFRLRRDSGVALVEHTGATMTLAAGVDIDLPATLAAIHSDESAGRAELFGDVDFDDLPELAEWLRGARAQWREQRDAALAAAAAECEQSGASARSAA